MTCQPSCRISTVKARGVREEKGGKGGGRREEKKEKGREGRQKKMLRRETKVKLI